jgi:hypothetical protein
MLADLFHQDSDADQYGNDNKNENQDPKISSKVSILQKHFGLLIFIFI